jgi:cyanophycinase-like exopeptidase
MIHRWIPDDAIRALADIPKDVILLGIDDETSLLRRGDSWSVWGAGLVHVLNGDSPRTYQHLEIVPGIELKTS